MAEHKIICIWLFWNIWILSPNFASCFREAVFYKEKGVYFANHVIETEETSSELECCSLCLVQTPCTSVNYKSSGDREGLCELNDRILKDFPHHGTKNSEYIYFEKLRVQVNSNSLLGDDFLYKDSL